MMIRKIQLSNRCNMSKKKGKQQHNGLSFVLILKPSSCLLVLFCNGGVFIAKGGSKVVVEPHKHGGVFIAKSEEDDLCTKNLVPDETVYNGKRIFVQNEEETRVAYRVWNPFCSKLVAAILGGVGDSSILSNHWVLVQEPQYLISQTLLVLKRLYMLLNFLSEVEGTW